MCLQAAIIGIASHLLFWIRGIWDPYASTILGAHLVGYIILSAQQVWQHGTFMHGLATSTAVSISYLASLFISVTVYRLVFHPLRHFPGPFAAKVTKAYGIWMARNGKMHEEHLSLCEKYGDFVRTGPNELVVLRINAIEKVHAGKYGCHKAGTRAEYFRIDGVPNLDSITDKDEHRRRRQVWCKAFNSKALATYEGHMEQVLQSWFATIDASAGSSINWSKYAMLIPTEMIFKVAYSRNMGSLASGHDRGLLQRAESIMKTLAPFGHCYWPAALILDFWPPKDRLECAKEIRGFVDERESAAETGEDIMNHLLEDYMRERPKAISDKKIMYAEGELILLAGIPTVGSTLTSIMSNMVRHPQTFTALREALEPVFGKSTPGRFQNSDLHRVEYLNGIIYEGLRLNPPTGSGAPRRTPPKGIMIDEIFIPGGIQVFTPNYAFGRSRKFFKQPHDFIPERWTTRPDLVLDATANFPFMQGPYNCVGKRYAMMVLRLVIATTVWHYDISLPPDGDGVSAYVTTHNKGVVKPREMNIIFTKKN
ncbi:cytochrome P450 [Thozetella sp. PMI_491]|nr:cytochrome P450 [Thozetella sp. PMI_491]